MAELGRYCIYHSNNDVRVWSMETSESKLAYLKNFENITLLSFSLEVGGILNLPKKLLQECFLIIEVRTDA